LSGLVINLILSHVFFIGNFVSVFLVGDLQSFKKSLILILLVDFRMKSAFLVFLFKLFVLFSFHFEFSIFKQKSESIRRLTLLDNLFVFLIGYLPANGIYLWMEGIWMEIWGLFQAPSSFSFIAIYFCKFVEVVTYRLVPLLIDNQSWYLIYLWVKIALHIIFLLYFFL